MKRMRGCLSTVIVVESFADATSIYEIKQDLIHIPSHVPLVKRIACKADH